MADCIFCKITRGEIPSNAVYEDELCMAFHDAAPAAPTHVLLVPKAHYATLAEVDDQALLGHLMATVGTVAALLGLTENGFRTVINTGRQGGQTVPHLHLHILSGRDMQWPPG